MEKNQDRAAVVKAWFAPLAWLVAIVFAAGGLYMQLASVTRVQADLERRMGDHDTRNAEQTSRSALLESRVASLEAARRDEASEVRRLGEVIDRINQNLVALCQATPGARCVR